MGFFEGFRRGMDDNWTYEVAGRQVLSLRFSISIGLTAAP